MRIRKKKWAEDELNESPIYIHEPDQFKEKWKERFGNKKPIHIELGSGKGGFISELASKNKDINYIAIDMVEAMLGIANRNIHEEYSIKKAEMDNILLIRKNVDYIEKTFDKKDEIERIYINFCNPWPRGKHNKRRLTHPRKLLAFKKFLKEDGKIYFKTDSDELFEDTLIYMENEGFTILDQTNDLENDDIFNGNIETEHEKMFKSANLKIKALIAIRRKDD